MAITTVGEALSKCVMPPIEHTRSWGNAGPGCLWRSSWYETAGWQGGNTVPTSGMAGQALTVSPEHHFRYTNPQGGQKKYLSKLQATYTYSTGSTLSLTCGSHYLADRLWHNSGLVVTDTAEQAVNSVAWPARDANGTSDGEGVWFGLEVAVTLGAHATTTVNYTNSQGVAGRIGIILTTEINALARGLLHVMRMDSGDTGVRSVQSVTLSTSMLSGTATLVAFRPMVLAMLSYGRMQKSFLGPIDLGFPEFPSDCCPMLGGNASSAFPLMLSEWIFAEG